MIDKKKHIDALLALSSVMSEHGISIDAQTGDVLITDNDGISEPYVISDECDIDQIIEVLGDERKD
tara:strand:- start:419 stop:616 length:198 start_codon:yes stop_codon:yes gene_type:complete